MPSRSSHHWTNGPRSSLRYIVLVVVALQNLRVVRLQVHVIPERFFRFEMNLQSVPHTSNRLKIRVQVLHYDIVGKMCD